MATLELSDEAKAELKAALCPGNASKKGEKLEARLLNCPFCGGRPNIDRWVNLTENGVIYCAACDFTLPPTVWNRRTPDLTEALARLKALEEDLRVHSFVCTKCGASWRDSGGGSNLCTACGYMAVDCGGKDKWADEIAAIRKALGAND